MTNANQSERTGFAEFRQEFADCWRALPFKGVFLFIVIAWLALFHFLGNSTLGYTSTSSLFAWLDWVVKQTGDDQHVPWVLAGVLALLWWKRGEVLRVPKRHWSPALIVVGLGILMHAMGYMVQQTRISLVGFFIGIYGIMGLVWGPAMMRATFFPVFLFAFCLPVSGTLSNSLTLPLRIVATKITTAVCSGVLGIHVIQEGTRLLDANRTYSYEVAAACSGIRSLTATLLLSLVYGFVAFRSPLRRLAMVAATIPLAIAANVLRLTTIILISEAFGRDAGLYVHESWWASLLPYIPMIGGILLLGYLLREKSEPQPEAKAAGASWSTQELGTALGCVGALIAICGVVPAVKEWTHNHQFTFAWSLTAAVLALLCFISLRSESKHAPEISRPRFLGWQSVVTLILALAVIAGTASGLQYRQRHQKLGTPGVKVVQMPIYDPKGELAGTNAIALPDRVLNYASEVVPVDRIVLDWLPKDTTYGQRVYKAPDGFQTQMTAVLMGSDRTSIHQPQYCLTGNGWAIDETELDSIPVSEPRHYQLPVKKLTASRLVQTPDGARVAVRGIYVYWFVAENRLTAEHGQRMLDMGLEMLRTGVLQRWAYVSCFSVCAPGQEQATYNRVKELIKATVPEFQLTTGGAATLARNP